MVKGINKFREFFKDFPNQYVLIGGAACDISFQDNDMDFRATKDLDMVLIVEALTREFAEKFWEFIQQGKYRNRIRSNGQPQFYRFDKPEELGYPFMIELFSRKEWKLQVDSVLTPIHVDDTVSSLSAILLNDAYYELLLQGRDIVDDISILKPTWLVPFKAKAWLDLHNKLEQGEHVDSRDIKKHRNDILRIVAEMILEPCELSYTVKQDMNEFIKMLRVTDAEMKNLKLAGVHQEDIINKLQEVYNL